MAPGGCCKSSPNTLETMGQPFLGRKPRLLSPARQISRTFVLAGLSLLLVIPQYNLCFIFTLCGLNTTVHRRLYGFLPVLSSSETSVGLLCSCPKAKPAQMDGSAVKFGGAVLAGFQPIPTTSL